VDPWARLHAFDQIDFSGPCTDPVPPADDAPLLSTAAATAAPEPAAALAVLLAAAGLKAQDFADQPPEAILRSAGQLLLQAADGLIRLLEARTRVRHQFGVGAHLTPFQSQGKNPLKWTRMPDQALRQMLGQADRGFLPGAHAVQGAFEDLQAHEIAMLAAMQDALAATMARFSPTAIKTRAQAKDGILPGAREAALWRFFEAEYERLAADNDAVYLDVFARHFRVAYERNLG
jgi:type VI secretion system FHA domain protein